MACVEFGIQQTTKDTDWVVEPGALPRLVEFLQDLEAGLSGANWRISYRSLFGAPLCEEFLGAGWTSHLAIWDDALSPEHHLDFFGKPPRLTADAALKGASSGIASRLVVAQMKKTDRDKDWPVVQALSRQALLMGELESVLHLREPELLRDVWAKLPPCERAELAARRPLLLELDQPRMGLARCLAVERAMWAEVNKLRYRAYQHAWKDFLRSWRKEDEFAWPDDGTLSFRRQHALLTEAVERFALPVDPLGGVNGRGELYARAAGEVAPIFGLEPSELSAICPPWTEMLT